MEFPALMWKMGRDMQEVKVVHYTCIFDKFVAIGVHFKRRKQKGYETISETAK